MPRVFVTARGGLLAGESGLAPVFQLTSGVTWHSWRAGLGGGLDWYQYRSIPLLATIERRLPLLGRRLALYASGGANLPEAHGQEQPWGVPAKEKAGYYAGAGLAIYLPVAGRHAVTFNLGYSEKTYRLDQSETFWCPTGNCPQRTNIFNYRLRRWGLEAGWTL